MERDRTWPPARLRWSELKHMARSPAHFRSAYLDAQESTASMGLGSLTHGILFGEPIVTFDGTRRGHAWDAFKEAHPHELIATVKERALADRIVKAVRDHPIAKAMRGRAEHELAWTMHGRKCAGRVDMLTEGWIFELKTTRCSEPGWFTREARRLAYDGQAAFYFDGARAAGHAVQGVKMVVVESKPPFAVTIMPVSERTLEAGRKLGRLLIEKVIACEAAGHWPSYCETETPLDVCEESELVFGDGDEEAA